MQRKIFRGTAAILIYNHFFEKPFMTGSGSRYSEEERQAMLERHCRVMNDLARLSGSSITIFNYDTRTHVFVSDNFLALFGYGEDEITAASDIGDIKMRMHPDDTGFFENDIHKITEILVRRQELRDFKLTVEYRVRRKDGKYVRAIEQHSQLEWYPDGTPWLTLSMLDISPDQSPMEGVRYQIINFNTSEHYSLADLTGEKSPILLSKREMEILSMIKSGMSSKRISEKLFISIHTVNTHRQRILEKLNAGNSLEAVRQAELMGSI